MTQMKAKLFNEEKVIKEKMKKMQKDFDNKMVLLQKKISEVGLIILIHFMYSLCAFSLILGYPSYSFLSLYVYDHNVLLVARP